MSEVNIPRVMNLIRWLTNRNAELTRLVAETETGSKEAHANYLGQLYVTSQVLEFLATGKVTG
jgi:hypothetical protein